MATSTRWGGFRPDPYNPNAVDADGDGIVQEGTLFERPAGTRFVNLDGSEIAFLPRFDSLKGLVGLKLVDERGADSDYIPSWRRRGQLSIGQRMGDIQSDGNPTIGQIVGAFDPIPEPKRAPKPPDPLAGIVIPEKYGGSAGLSQLRELYPELFDYDGNLKKPSSPRSYKHGLVGGANDLMEGVTSWSDVRERLKGKTIIAYDYETTGFINQGGRGVQIGAAKIVDGEVVDRFNVYINPGVPFDNWSDFSQKNLRDKDGNLLSQEAVNAFPSSREAHEQFLEWIGQDEFFLMAHNGLEFDDQMLEIELNASGIPQMEPAGRIDTLSLARDTIDVNEDNPVAANHQLGTLTRAFGIELGDKAHTADADSAATAQLLFKLIDSAEERDLPIDLVLPEPARIRSEERQARFEKDLKRFRELRTIHSEIEEATKAIAQEKRSAREQERRSPPEIAETDTPEDVVDIKELSENIDQIQDGFSQIVNSYADGRLTIIEDGEDFTIEVEGVSGSVRLKPGDSDELASLTPQGETVLSELRRVGKSVRLEAEKLVDQTEFGRKYKKRQQELISERNDLVSKREVLITRRLDLTARAASAALGRPMTREDLDSMNEQEWDLTLNEIDNNPALAKMLSMTNIDIENQINAAIETVNEDLYVTQFQLRRIRSAKLLDVIYGKERDGVDGLIPSNKLNKIKTKTVFRGIPTDSISAQDRQRATANLDRIMDEVSDLFPDAWKTKLNELSSNGQHGAVEISIRGRLDDETGAFMSNRRDGSIFIAIPYSLISDETAIGKEKLKSYMAHEMFHAMEYAIPEVSMASRLEFYSRTRGTTYQDLNKSSAGLLKMDDDFSDPYTGTIYPETESLHSEIFTTTIDRVFTPGAPSALGRPDPDQNQIDTFIGMLLTTKPDATEGKMDNLRSIAAPTPKKAENLDRNGVPLTISVPARPDLYGQSITDDRNFGNPRWREVVDHFGESGQTPRGTPISPTDESIPQTLYHVSPAYNQILSDGVIRAAGDGGLGGDDADRIVSMTTKREVADNIVESMQAAIRLSNSYNASDSPEDNTERFMDELRKYGNPTDSDRRQLEALFRYNDVSGAIKYFFTARESAASRAGREERPNPLFFGDVYDKFSRLTPEDVGIVEIDKSDLDNGSMLVDFDLNKPGGLSEVRMYGDIKPKSINTETASPTSSAGRTSEQIRQRNTEVISTLEASGGFFDQTRLTRDQRQEFLKTETSKIAESFTYNMPEDPDPISRFDSFINAYKTGSLQREINQLESDNNLNESSKLRLERLRKVRDLLEERSPEEIRSMAVSFIRNLLDDPDTRVAVGLPKAGLEGLIESGRYLTTHDESITSMHSGSGVRAGYEAAFGIPADAPSSVRPASGFMLYGPTVRATKSVLSESYSGANKRPELDKKYLFSTAGTTMAYGANRVVLRKEVHGRTKFGSGDSLNNTFDPARLEGATDEEILTAMVGNIGGKGASNQKYIDQSFELLSAIALDDPTLINSHTADDLLNRGLVSDYHETLIFGSFDLQDVEEISILLEMVPGYEQTLDRKVGEKLDDLIEGYPLTKELVPAEDLTMIRNLIKSDPDKFTELIVSVKGNLTASAMVKQLAKKRMTDKIRSKAPDIVVNYVGDGTNLDDQVAEAASKAGIPEEEYLPRLMAEKLQTIAQRLREGEDISEKSYISYLDSEIQEKVSFNPKPKVSAYPVATGSDYILMMRTESEGDMDGIVIHPYTISEVSLLAFITRPNYMEEIEGSYLSSLVLNAGSEEWNKVFVDNEPINTNNVSTDNPMVTIPPDLEPMIGVLSSFGVYAKISKEES